MFNFFKKKLILVGSRTNLSDIITAAEDCGYKIIGILDKHYWGNTEKICGIPVIGSEEELLDPNSKWRKYNFFPANWWDGKQAIGDVFDADQLRRERIDLLDKSGVNVVNLIMNSRVDWIHNKRDFTIGKGVLILAGAKIGEHVSIGDYSILDWDVKLSAFNKIGRNSTIGYDTLLAHTDIGDNVRIGVRCVLIPSRKKRVLTVGNNAIVYIGSLVLDDVPEDSVYTMHGRTRKRFKKTV